MLREASGRVFNVSLRLLGITPLRDTQCGFKAFTRSAAQTVFSRVEQDGFGFEVEAILVAQALGHSKRVPDFVSSPEPRSFAEWSGGLPHHVDRRVAAADALEPAVRGIVDSAARAPRCGMERDGIAWP